jgi:metal-sulfur cluster biosynthetic enzyme
MSAGNPSEVKEQVLARLRGVIDPETRADVVRMRLIEDLEVDEQGKVSLTFRPSSPICPLAVYLATQIKQAVNEVPGVTGQWIQVEGYIAAEDLTKMINEEV